MAERGERMEIVVVVERGDIREGDEKNVVSSVLM